MAVSGKSLWQKIALAYPSGEEDRAEGQALFREYSRKGHLEAGDAPPSPGAVVDFFRRLSLLRSASSPVCRRRDPRWMSRSDFQFFQVRRRGSFFRALAELPYLRTEGILLPPVTCVREDMPLYPLSHSLLDPSLGDPAAEACGLSTEDQFRLFLAAAHLAGLTVGYYLSPLIAPDSAVIYRRPEFFRWTLRGEEAGSEGAAEVARLTAAEFARAGTYDYGALRGLAEAAGFSAASPDNPGEAVSFDLGNPAGREYFSDIFLGLQSRYALDFLYLDLPDGLDPAAAEETLARVRAPRKGALKKYTGWALDYREEAEPRFREAVPLYCSREEPGAPLDEAGFHRWFHLLGELFDFNRERKVPYLRGVPLAGGTEIRAELRLYFLTRFSGLSRCRRPLLLGEDFGRDAETRRVQGRIEDVYTRYLDVLEKGRLLQVVADESYAWWIIRERGRSLIGLTALGKGPVPPVAISYGSFVNPSKILTVVEYDFSSSQGNLYLSADNSLRVDGLEPEGFRLFSLQ